MNLPSGRLIEQGLKLEIKAVLIRLKAMMEEDFTGYLILTTEGRTGLEESVLLFRKGGIAGSIFSFETAGKEVIGEKALTLSLNSFRSKYGIIDISALSIQQIDLIVAFNEELKIVKQYSFKEIEKMIPPSFNQDYASDLSPDKKEPSRDDLFKEFGLAGLE